MIKIEITDPFRESPEVLVRVAKFLMQCAGHDMVKAPEDLNNPLEYLKQKREDILNSPHTPEILHELKTDELPGPTGHGIASAPYQHCSESDLTHASFTDIAKALDEEINIGDTEGKEEFKIAGRTILNEDGSINTLPPHIHEVKKPKSRKKIKIKDYVNIEVRMSEKTVTPRVEPIENIIPPPPTNLVNGNTLIDKIVKGTAEGKLNHTIVTQIVRKHGLESTKDVFTNEHLIPAINESIDELLRGG